MSDLTGYPSIDRPWLKYFTKNVNDLKVPNCSMYEMLYEYNKNHPEGIALNYYGNKITYGELFENIKKAAKSFYGVGVRENDVIALCTINIPETIYAIYALNHLGAVVNLIDPRSPLEFMEKFIKEGNSNTLVCVDKVYPYMENIINKLNIKNVIVVSPSDSLPTIKAVIFRMKNKISTDTYRWQDFIKKGCDVTPIYADYKRDKCAVMAHTGGTTGVPKTVMISSDNVNSIAFSYKYTGVPFKRGQRFFNDLPPFIIYGLTVGMHTVLCNGIEVITYPVFDSVNFPKVFRKYKPNHFSALSGHLKYLIEDSHVKKMNLDFLINAGVGGDSLNVNLEEATNDFFEKHNCEYMVCKGYGMSELAGTALISSKTANAIGSVGIPLIFNKIKIVDTDDNCELGYNSVGELWISGPSIMLGYLGDEEATNERISYDDDGTKWLHTGDLAFINEDGLVFIQGRMRRMYLSVMNGQPAKIYPYVIETEVLKHEAVSEVCAVGKLMRGSTYYEMIVYVVLKDKSLKQGIIREELFELSKKIFHKRCNQQNLYL